MSIGEATRKKVHVCGVCQALWEGPTPPRKCPGCQAEGQWTPAEVGRQEGFVGGRVFVPGTDKPMTRIFLCNACSKMTTTRKGADAPDACPKCGAKASDLAEGQSLFQESVPQPIRKRPEPPAPEPRKKPEPQSEVDLTSDGEAAEWSPAHLRGAITADEYRREWIADRVAALIDSGEYDLEKTDYVAALVWGFAERLYDTGKRLGYLP
jgi:hypothetical protein